MNLKLLKRCFYSGIASTIISFYLFNSYEFNVSLIGIITLPGLVLPLMLIRGIDNVCIKNKLLFTLMCFITYIISATITLFFNHLTSGLIIIFISVLSNLIIVLIYNDLIENVLDMRKSLVTSAVGAFFAGLIIYSIYLIIKYDPDSSNGEQQAYKMQLVQLFIHPLWQTAFGLAIKE